MADPSLSPPPHPTRRTSDDEPFETQRAWSGIIEQPVPPLPPKPKRKRVSPAQLEILVEMFQQVRASLLSNLVRAQTDAALRSDGHAELRRQGRGRRPRGHDRPRGPGRSSSPSLAPPISPSLIHARDDDKGLGAEPAGKDHAPATSGGGGCSDCRRLAHRRPVASRRHRRRQPFSFGDPSVSQARHAPAHGLSI